MRQESRNFASTYTILPMRIHLNPVYDRLRPFVERLRESFAANEGKLIYQIRNTVRLFEIEGVRLVVKRFRQPNPFQAFVYAWLRRSKAQRAYEHAVRLRTLGFDTPVPIAWCEVRCRGLLRDSYLVTLYVDDRPLSEMVDRYPEPEALSVLDAFAAYAARLHDAGIEHLDLHHNNVLYRRDEATDELRFRLIDINRMRFSDAPLSLRRRMFNLRRLTHRAEIFVYVMERYAEVCDYDLDDTLLRSIFYRLMLIRRSRLKARFRRHRP